MLKARWMLRVVRGSRTAGALIFLANLALAQNVGVLRYPISENEIAKVLVALGMSVDASQIHIPVHMSAAIAEPKLEIVTASPLGSNQIRLEFRCQATSVCLPFLAILDVRNAASVVSVLRSEASPVSLAGHPTTLRMVDPLARPQLKVGSRAVMEIRDGHMDIHLPVLAMDTAAIGQALRVCTLDRKRVFHATVTGDRTVAGAMQ